MSVIINDTFTPPAAVAFSSLTAGDAFTLPDGTHGWVTNNGAFNLATGINMAVPAGTLVYKRKFVEATLADPA